MQSIYYLRFQIFFLYTWYDVEYMYLNDHAHGMKISVEDASILISVIGIVNMFGEIILGWAGDRPWINPSIVYAVCMLFCGAVIAVVPLLNSYWSLCFVAGGFGFGACLREGASGSVGCNSSQRHRNHC